MVHTTRVATTLSAVLLAGALLQTSPVAGAQAAGSPAPAPQARAIADVGVGEADRRYSRGELRSFVIAGLQIDRTIRHHGRARSTGDIDTADIQAQIQRILDATPRIDRQLYRRIAEDVRTDRVLRRRVRRVLAALRREKRAVLSGGQDSI